MAKITKRFVDGLKPDPTQEKQWMDDTLSGFGVRMTPAGAASYFVRYRTQDGAARRMVLGKVGTLTPDEARKIAAEKLGAVAKGGDPSAERTEARKAMTVAELCAWYLEQAEAGVLLGRRGDKIKANTLYQDRSRINTHVLPLLGGRKVASLTLEDIERFQADIAAGKTAKGRDGRGSATTGGTGAASRCAGMLRTILEHGKRRKVIAANPAAGMKLMADGKRNRFLTIEEIQRLGQAMREAEAEGENQTGLAAVRALLLTGCRRNEILALPRSWLDARARCIRFEDTKSGAQLRPIGFDAAQLLASRPERKGCPWLFPADRGEGHFIGLPRVLERLCERAGLEGVTIHVLRHSFAAAAAEMGFSELTIAGLLGHTVASVTGRYAHVPDSALVAAADRIAERIVAALDGVRANTALCTPPDLHVGTYRGGENV